MSQGLTPTGWRLQRSYEPNRVADRQLASAYDCLLSIPAKAPPPDGFDGLALASQKAREALPEPVDWVA